ncbi:MAG: DNA polymerase III subunit alpha [Bacillota bacterium]
MTWSNLHRHSMFSSWDGFGDCNQAAEYAAKIGQPALGITDHGDISGLINHYNACKKHDIKPVLGVEGYFMPEFSKENDRYHIVILAKNMKGYQNLMKLQTEASRDYYHYKPNFTFELLEKYHEGLIMSTACAGGYIPKMITNGMSDENLIEIVNKFKSIFGDDFYLEVMPVDLDIQPKINSTIVRLGDKTDTPVIITNDSHYTEADAWDTYRLMMAIKDKNPGPVYENRYMPTEEQLKTLLNNVNPDIDIEPLIKNTEELVNKVNVELDFDNMMPDQDWEKPSPKMLKELAYNGLDKKEKNTEEYINQLEFELDVIHSQGYDDYFLLCYDIVEYAKDNGIRYGFGRGSVGGSLLAYSLGLTDVDPIIFGTDFERFMRKEKKKMPDIDMDFDANRRDEILDYLLKKYEGKSAHISTFGYYKEKNLMNDLAKVLDIPDDDRDDIKSELSRIIDGGDRPPLAELQNNAKLRKYDKKYNYLEHFQRLYNQTRFTGKHAAGIAIAPDDITNYVGLQKYKGSLQTAYDLDGLSDIGVLKMDVLGLSTLSVINDVEKKVGVELKEEYLEDKNVYKMLSEGKSVGVFQFEKPGAVDVLQRVNPKNIHELIACNALNRPAPKQLGILDEYIRAKNGEVNKDGTFYEYAKETYGAIIFQEQVMRICRDLGELDWDKTDYIMKALGEDEEVKNEFIKGASNNGLTENEANELFNQMTAYLFNKGHGAAYSITSFYTAWLKYYYPIEFFYALLKNEKHDYKINKYLAAATQNDILILLAHVNGGADFTIQEVEGEKVIQEGIMKIKGIGKTTAEEIGKRAPFKSEEDFIERVPKRYANKRVIEKLQEYGALQFNSKTYWRRTIKWNQFLQNMNTNIY